MPAPIVPPNSKTEFIEYQEIKIFHRKLCNFRLDINKNYFFNLIYKYYLWISPCGENKPPNLLPLAFGNRNCGQHFLVWQ
jgi:hypothetical protein